MNSKYEKIIKMPHHVSRNHPQMTMHQRAAQFAPFAALTGHGAAIQETARLTDSIIELSEQERILLDKKLALILEHLCENPSVIITYFLPDLKKDGGCYSTISGRVSKYDEYLQILEIDKGIALSLNTIVDIQSEIFKGIIEE